MRTMRVTIAPVRGPRGVRFNVLVENAYLTTGFGKRRHFATESAARKEVARLLGDDVVVDVTSR